MVQKHFQWLPNQKLSWKKVILTIFDQRDFLRKIQTNSRISGCKHSKQISMRYFFSPWPTKTLGELSFFEVPEVSNRLMHLQLRGSNYRTFLVLNTLFVCLLLWITHTRHTYLLPIWKFFLKLLERVTQVLFGFELRDFEQHGFSKILLLTT